MTTLQAKRARARGGKEASCPVRNVPADLDAEITTDGAGEAVVRARLAEQLATALDGVVAFPNLTSRRQHGGDVNKKGGDGKSIIEAVHVQ
jgi:hypothetical protein